MTVKDQIVTGRAKVWGKTYFDIIVNDLQAPSVEVSNVPRSKAPGFKASHQSTDPRYGGGRGRCRLPCYFDNATAMIILCFNRNA
jgi:hypothetical protein